jgi:DNA-directed RNA polymerase subunit RPC12/RpoP
MVRCTNCGYDIPIARKEWIMKPKSKANAPAIKTSQYICPRCGKKFRVYVKIEDKP